MVYVKHFDILGVDTAQIPCIELQGVPNAATVGAVGLLGMDMTSEDKEIYVCTAVNGAIYTWKSLKDGRDGVSVTKSEINANGELVLTLSDGVTLNAGVVKGEKGENGADGKAGANGNDGVGISKVEINTDNELVVTYTDGHSVNLGKVVGDDGVGISKVESGVVSESNGYTVTPITVTKTDGTTITLELKAKNNVIELNSGVPMSFFIGTHAEWEAYTGDKTNVMFMPTDSRVYEADLNLNSSVDLSGVPTGWYHVYYRDHGETVTLNFGLVYISDNLRETSFSCLNCDSSDQYQVTVTNREMMLYKNPQTDASLVTEGELYYKPFGN